MIFLAFFFIFWISNADEEENPKINSIFYNWNISINTTVIINWTNLEKCNNLYIDDSKISISSKTVSQIEYKFSSKPIYNWKITLECNNDLKLVNYYSFPYIRSIWELNWWTNLSIIWENFWFNASVNLNWWTFEKDISQNWVITWKIPNNLVWNDLYVDVNWLKSNIVNMDIKIPEITFIHSDNNFINWSKVTIYWKNLNYYNNTKVSYWDLVTTKFTLNWDWSISFLSDWDLWKININVISWNYISNTVEIENNGEQPLINSVTKISKVIDFNWEEVRKELLLIKWDNFSDFTNDISVFNREEYLQIYSTSKNEILVFPSESVYLDWHYYVIINNIKSNIIWINKDLSLPSITSIEQDWLVWWNRSIKVYLSNFNSNTDDIYLNNTKTNYAWCISWMCRIEIPENILKWSIWVWRKWIMSNNLKYFDLEYDKSPYVDNIYFDWDLKYWTKFEITWKNFNNSSVTTSNFSWLRDNWESDLKITDSKIYGSLFSNYNINELSSLSIAKFWYTTDLSFKWIDINSSKLYWAWFIEDIKWVNDLWLIKQWEAWILTWKWFRDWDYLIIWNTKILLNVINNNNANFILPSDINIGEYSAYIENDLWFKWNTKKIIILESWNNWNITFQSKSLNKNQFFIIEDNPISIYSIDLDNKIDDYYIENIEFKIDNYNKDLYLWTFDFKINWVTYDTQLVSDTWLITFNWYFPLVKNNQITNIELFKKSPYIKTWTFNINLVKESLVIKMKSDDSIINNIENNSFYPNIIKITSKWNTSCIDTSLDNINCNKFLLNNTYIEKKDDITNKNNTDNQVDNINSKENTTNSTAKVDKTQEVYERIVSVK